jgi:Flp pilus assembly protein TadB
MQTALPARREALRGVPDGLQPGQERTAQEAGMKTLLEGFFLGCMIVGALLFLVVVVVAMICLVAAP